MSGGRVWRLVVLRGGVADWTLSPVADCVSLERYACFLVGLGRIDDWFVVDFGLDPADAAVRRWPSSRLVHDRGSCR